MTNGKRNLKQVKFWENSEDRRLHLFVGFCVSFLLFFILILSYPPYFFSNDDFRMRTLVNGTYMGESSSYGVFISYPLSYGLHLLYRLFPNVNWYGYGTVAMLFLASWTIIVLMIKDRPKQQMILFIPLWILFFSLHLMLPQFTLVSTMTGLAFLLLVLEAFSRVKKGEWLFSYGYLTVCLFFFTATLINRMYAFYLFAAYLLLYTLFDFKGFLALMFAKGKKYLMFSFVLLLIFLSAFFAQKYIRDYQLKEYYDYNLQRSKYYDYYRDGTKFEDKADFYESLGITKNIFHLMYYRFYDIAPEITTENYEKMNEAFYREKDLSFKGVFHRIKNSVFFGIREYGRKRVRWNLFGTFFIALVIFVDLFRVQRGKDILRLFAVGLFTIGLSAYFKDAGRLIDRLQWSFLLFSAIPLYFLWQKNRLWPLARYKAWMIAFMVLVLAFFNLKSVEPSYTRMKVLSEKNEEIFQYTRQRPEDFFFASATLSASGSEAVLAQNLTKRNFDTLGNWIAFSPMYYERNKSYGFISASQGLREHLNVYYMDDSRSEPYLQKYFQDHYGLTAVKIDEFQVTDYDAKAFKGRGKSTVSVYSFIHPKEGE